MRFAFLIIGDFDSQVDRASIHDGAAQIIGAASREEAAAIAKTLYKSGVDCIELCGAFGADGARKIIEATENKIPIGYITHLQEQDEVYQKAFSKPV